MSLRTLDGRLHNAGYEQITSLSSATALTVPAGALIALITIEGADVRWRDDGTDPTSSVGMPLPAGQSFVYNGQLSRFKVIQTAPNAILNVSYYKVP